jgi:hypothetical protein
MDPPDLNPQDSLDRTADRFGDELWDPDLREAGGGTGTDWLEDVVARLEEDPDECWAAVAGLSELDEDVRTQVIAALAAYGERPGVRELLRLFTSEPEPAIRSGAVRALTEDVSPADLDGRQSGNDSSPDRPGIAGGSASLPAIPTDRGGQALTRNAHRSLDQIVRSLVTALDGDGRGTIMLSVRDHDCRRTAAFRCDVRRGVLDMVDDVEQEDSSAGCMVDQWLQQADGDFALDVPELAVRLLEGCLLLSGPDVPAAVRAWLDTTIGCGTRISALTAPLSEQESGAISDDEMTARANLVLDACPGWLDRSALTCKLAEEIALREGCETPDPIRDAGAYRYLFEHLLIGRLELYARMLLWMALIWRSDGRPELARAAFSLASQLSDEQYAVPSHPFTVTLTTRSLQAAQDELLRADEAWPDARGLHP